MPEKILRIQRFKYVFLIDLEIINTIFEACQNDPTNPGLILEDVQRVECVAAVDQIVGESNGAIDYLFEAADTNGDGIVMRSEVSEAFHSLALQRSQKKSEKGEKGKKWRRWRKRRRIGK